jgi:hypothetical protein
MDIDEMQVSAYDSVMVKKRSKSEVAESIRQAVLSSGRSRYDIAMASGVDQGQLSRFMLGQNLGLPGLEALAAELGLRIVVIQIKGKGG